MCRWISYIGEHIFMDQVVLFPSHSLVKQSFDTKMRFSRDGNVLNLNGDGFGVGWYSEKQVPGLFKDEQPAWSSRNLSNLCEQVKAHICFAHIRASTTGAVQRSNCHPFKYKNWLFQHNGHVSDFDVIKQELHGDIAPDLYPRIKGSTDSETFFFLALTYGLQDNPKQALQKMVKRVQMAAEDAGTEGLLNLSCALSDGDSLYTLRYAEGEKPNTQFYSTNFNLCKTSDMDEKNCPTPNRYVVVVSEPLDNLEGQWTEVPENSFTIIKDGFVRHETFMEEYADTSASELQ